MVVLIRGIADNWYWLAGVLVLLALWSVRRAALSRREWRYSIFGLEKDQARRRTLGHLRTSFILLAVAGGLYLANDRLVPMLPEVEPSRSQAVDTPVPTITPTPTSTPWIEQVVVKATSDAPEAEGGTPTASPTPTAEATPVPTSTPTPSVPSVSGCGVPGVSISSPGAGAHVSGVVSVSGSANIEGFQFYKVEVAMGDNPAAYAVIDDVHHTAVPGGTLATWNTAPYPAGAYWLRLTVVDQTGNFPQPCAVRVILSK